MKEEEMENPFNTGLELLIDGDILVYQSCCVFNEDTSTDRIQITRQLHKHVTELMLDAKCSSYKLMLTAKANFRDFIVSDYKANRKDKERPVNLVFAKQYAMKNFNSFCLPGLEADDLIGIYNGLSTVIWSLDKDLKQLQGKHLDNATRKVEEITSRGYIYCNGKANKIKFAGNIGLYFQMLTGDTADYILGCGKREMGVFLSGKRKGLPRIRRVGVGPKEAMGYVEGKTEEEAKAKVISLYKEWFPFNYRDKLEEQANLLFMVRELNGDLIRRWTIDGRAEYMNYKTGEILSGAEAKAAKDGRPKKVQDTLCGKAEV